MKGKMNTDMGEIIIDRDVLVNMKDGVTKLLKKESAGRGVNVVVSEDGVSIELHVIVAYGVSIRAVAQNVLESVRYKIEEFTGLKVEKINVIVDGVRIVDED